MLVCFLKANYQDVMGHPADMFTHAGSSSCTLREWMRLKEWRPPKIATTTSPNALSCGVLPKEVCQRSFPLQFQKKAPEGRTLAVRPSCLRVREEETVEALRKRKATAGGVAGLCAEGWDHREVGGSGKVLGLGAEVQSHSCEGESLPFLVPSVSPIRKHHGKASKNLFLGGRE